MILKINKIGNREKPKIDVNKSNSFNISVKYEDKRVDF